ncbi:unnamed protein product, partial [Urochloa humidicola]
GPAASARSRPGPRLAGGVQSFGTGGLDGVGGLVPGGGCAELRRRRPESRGRVRGAPAQAA